MSQADMSIRIPEHSAADSDACSDRSGHDDAVKKIKISTFMNVTNDFSRRFNNVKQVVRRAQDLYVANHKWCMAVPNCMSHKQSYDYQYIGYLLDSFNDFCNERGNLHLNSWSKHSYAAIRDCKVRARNMHYSSTKDALASLFINMVVDYSMDPHPYICFESLERNESKMWVYKGAACLSRNDDRGMVSASETVGREYFERVLTASASGTYKSNLDMVKLGIRDLIHTKGGHSDVDENMIYNWCADRIAGFRTDCGATLGEISALCVIPSKPHYIQRIIRSFFRYQDTSSAQNIIKSTFIMISSDLERDKSSFKNRT